MVSTQPVLDDSSRGIGTGANDIAPARVRIGVVVCVATAFAARLTLALARGPIPGNGGYQFYLSIARSLLDGHGLCLEPHVGCALRTPLYPLFVTPFLAAGWTFPGLAVAQSAIGASLSWMAWRLGRSLFDPRTGLLAAAMAALSPYAIVHDTALQDTVVVNALMALSILLLLRTPHARRVWIPVCAGVVLALAVLTTARVALFLPGAVAWVATEPRARARDRARQVVLILLPVALLVGGWIARNARVVGAPVLTTEAGESLWVANSAVTFAHFPGESIDGSVVDAYRRLADPQRRALSAVLGSEVQTDRLLAAWGYRYIAEHPVETMSRSLEKIWVAASARLSPARSAVSAIGYTLVFAPIHLLAALGLWESRRAWRTHGVIYVFFAAFAVTTAIFWAHTSHKSQVDVVLFVYAASVVTRRRRAAPATP